MVAGQVADRGPGAHPQSRAQRVEGEEPRPGHPGDPGNDDVGLAQYFDEPSPDDNLAAVAGEEGFGSGHAFLSEQDIAAEAQHQGAAADPSDRVADVIS